ncbi:heavy metal translocating P-type ATPase [Paenibacillus humicus]|uniref:heavy metal translocating P-type ATPase n=1 Tax=Paenibacillus humicus TaxID=412861 RepID=UPI000FDA9566|nr:heavy metal translocating P-type ATPase [Paenibacillus humicus]
MTEYRVKGLSCGNCTLELEREIRKLPYGDTATLHYSSARLVIDERVPLDKLRKILKSDGAALIGSAAAASSPHAGVSSSCVLPESGQGHSSEHEHGSSEDSHNHNHSQSKWNSTAGVAAAASGEAPDTGNAQTGSHTGSDGHGHDHNDGHHDHDHGDGSRFTLYLIGVSFLLFALAAWSGSLLSDTMQIVFYVAAIILSGWSTFWRGLRNLLRFRFNIDTLMTVALVGAAAIQEWKEATLVAILFGINELLEGLGMSRARRSMDRLLQAAPKEAVLLADGGQQSVPVSRLREGDLVLVKAGSQIPSDGTIVSGQSSVNEAAITGESLPVDKKIDDQVFGGSLNNEGMLTVRIDRAYQQSSLAKILQLVQEAQESKTPTELFINRFSRYYTPFIMLVSLLVILIPPLLLGGSWNHWLYEGLAVLIVGCPCALILSSPVAILAGITRLAREGILVKGGAFLEQLGKIDLIAFDKTGTLTKGRPHVAAAESWDDRFLPIAAAIESGSSHPLAGAVLDYAEQHSVHVEPLESETAAGRGLKASKDGATYTLGSQQLIESLGLADYDNIRASVDSFLKQGYTLVLVADDTRVLGMFGISDELRPESPAVLQGLRRAGIRRTVMLTGDNAQSADRMAKAAGLTDVYAGLLPEDKVKRIQELKSSGKVAMIGDGINDAPALAAADLGIAMGKGTDSAIETADLVLMQDNLTKLPSAVRTAKTTNRIIRFNLGVALGLKLIALLLTIPGWLTLWIAILSDMGATIFVSLVSLTLLLPVRKKDKA